MPKIISSPSDQLPCPVATTLPPFPKVPDREPIAAIFAASPPPARSVARLLITTAFACFAAQPSAPPNPPLNPPLSIDCHRFEFQSQRQSRLTASWPRPLDRAPSSAPAAM